MASSQQQVAKQCSLVQHGGLESTFSVRSREFGARCRAAKRRARVGIRLQARGLATKLERHTNSREVRVGMQLPRLHVQVLNIRWDWCMLGVSSVDVWTMNISISVHWRLKFGPSMNPYIKSSLFKPPHPLQACTENLPNMESHLLYICKTTNFRPNLCLNYRILAVRVQKRHLYQVPLFMGS